MSAWPGWAREWCEAEGLNVDNPRCWPDAARAAFMAEKKRRFTLRWRWLSAVGQPEIIRNQSGRAALINEVRRDLDDALSPIPDRGPYEGNRMWPLAKHAEKSADPWDEVAVEDALAYVDAHPGAERLSVRTVKCLVWLARDFGGKVAA